MSWKVSVPAFSNCVWCSLSYKNTIYNLNWREKRSVPGYYGCGQCDLCRCSIFGDRFKVQHNNSWYHIKGTTHWHMTCEKWVVHTLTYYCPLYRCSGLWQLECSLPRHLSDVSRPCPVRGQRRGPEEEDPLPSGQ